MGNFNETATSPTKLKQAKMKGTLILLIGIFFTNLVSAQFFTPGLTLTEYQQFYGGNLIKDIKTFKLKGTVKSVTTTLLDIETNKEVSGQKSLAIHTFEFLPNQKLKSYTQKTGSLDNENNELYSHIQTTIYSFDDGNSKLLKITDTYNKRTTEKEFDTLGFLKYETSYYIDVNGKHVYHEKNYTWNKKNNVATYFYKFYSPDANGKRKLSFKGESYQRPFYTSRIIAEGSLKERYKTTMFDERGNIIHISSHEDDMRSTPPNNYDISYEYNENNELLKIFKNGSTNLSHFNGTMTTFEYTNYDEYGNWQKLTVSTTDKDENYTKVKYKREILYY